MEAMATILAAVAMLPRVFQATAVALVMAHLPSNPAVTATDTPTEGAVIILDPTGVAMVLGETSHRDLMMGAIMDYGRPVSYTHLTLPTKA